METVAIILSETLSAFLTPNTTPPQSQVWRTKEKCTLLRAHLPESNDVLHKEKTISSEEPLHFLNTVDTSTTHNTCTQFCSNRTQWLPVQTLAPAVQGGCKCAKSALSYSQSSTSLRHSQPPHRIPLSTLSNGSLPHQKRNPEKSTAPATGTKLFNDEPKTLTKPRIAEDGRRRESIGDGQSVGCGRL